ncbi:MATE family efflux transporter [Vibrio sp. 99-70-13A1]|uniref:MATE family efflux transporter n=1 Tax=Vibrio sp. 99-70-13A1 TaxID=2607601 RepID=UPI0014933AE5|nr:MATE family efflux transporter [Vibrio sp. 99-70-13A1]NOH98718.1 MATE family efflux transporter [Vibrio sp. 99-70-13A1]
MPMMSKTMKLVISRTIPLTVGMFAIMLVQLVDSIFIGMLGTDELAVHGITLPFQALLIGIQVGIGVATTSIISQACGAKLASKSTATATISLVAGSIFIALICVTLWLAKSPIFWSFTSSDTSVAQQQILQSLFNQYWPFWLLSALSVAVLYLTSCIYRANEDTKVTGKMFMLASVINLILDPIFIFMFDLGLVGAALASTLGYSVCALYMVIKAKQAGWLRAIRNDHVHIKYFIELFRMVVPTTMNQMLPSLSAFISMVLISRMGTDAIAFWSLLSRMESFLLVFTLALTMSIPPMIGRYLGEGKSAEITDLLLSTAKFLLIFHMGLAVLLMISSDALIPLISQDEHISAWLKFALLVVPFSYAPLGLCMLLVSVCNALRLPKAALLISFVRLIVLYVPAVLIGSLSHDIKMTIVAVSVAHVLAGCYAWFKLKQHLKAGESQFMIPANQN